MAFKWLNRRVLWIHLCGLFKISLRSPLCGLPKRTPHPSDSKKTGLKLSGLSHESNWLLQVLKRYVKNPVFVIIDVQPKVCPDETGCWKRFGGRDMVLATLGRTRYGGGHTWEDEIGC